jgi:hypothetical protein
MFILNRFLSSNFISRKDAKTQRRLSRFDCNLVLDLVYRLTSALKTSLAADKDLIS